MDQDNKNVSLADFRRSSEGQLPLSKQELIKLAQSWIITMDNAGKDLTFKYTGKHHFTGVITAPLYTLLYDKNDEIILLLLPHYGRLFNGTTKFGSPRRNSVKDGCFRLTFTLETITEGGIKISGVVFVRRDYAYGKVIPDLVKTGKWKSGEFEILYMREKQLRELRDQITFDDKSTVSRDIKKSGKRMLSTAGELKQPKPWKRKKSSETVSALVHSNNSDDDDNLDLSSFDLNVSDRNDRPLDAPPGDDTPNAFDGLEFGTPVDDVRPHSLEPIDDYYYCPPSPYSSYDDNLPFFSSPDLDESSLLDDNNKAGSEFDPSVDDMDDNALFSESLLDNDNNREWYNLCTWN